MFEIRKYEQKPVVVIRPATVQELATYEKQKQERAERSIKNKK